MTTKSNLGIWMGSAVAIAAIIAAAVLFFHGADEKGVRLALDSTARWSFLLFWLAYCGSAIAALLGPPYTILGGHGREFGLAFASAHLVHVGLIIWLGEILGRIPLRGGLLIFFLVALFWTYLLAVLSFGNPSKAFGPRAWQAIRIVGVNYILLSFGRDFVLPILHPKPSQENLAHFLAYAPFAAMSVAAPLLVLAMTAYRRRRMHSATA